MQLASGWAVRRAPGAHRPQPRLRASRNAASAPLDLRYAVQMAAASFEAGLEPTNRDGYRFRDRWEDGTVVYYLSPQFVSEQYDAVIRIVVYSARDLRKMDFLACPSDPYIVMRCGKSQATTRMLKDVANPDWGADEHFLWVPKRNNGSIHFRVLDADLGRDNGKSGFMQDDELGRASVDLSDLVCGQETSHELRLQGPNAGKATLHVGLERIDVSAGVSGDASSAAHARLHAALTDAQLRSAKHALDRSAEAMAAAAEESRTRDETDKKDRALSSVSFLSDTAVVDEAEQESKRLMRNGWDALATVLFDECAARERVLYLTGESTDTNLWISRNVAAKRVLIAFRGTEFRKQLDVKADLRFMQRWWPHGSRNERVHSGFYDAWASVARRVRDALDGITGGDTEAWDVWVTGHSLGAAVATLCAAELSRKTGYRVHLYNYGSPQVGNKEFARQMVSHLATCWRMHTQDDLIPRLPPADFGFQHIDTGAYITEDGRLHRFNGEDQVVLGAATRPQQVTTRVAAEVADVRRFYNLKDIYQLLDMTWSDIVNLDDLLQDLKGPVHAHFQPSYMRALCRTLARAAEDNKAVTEALDKADHYLTRALELLKQAKEKEKKKEQTTNAGKAKAQTHICAPQRNNIHQ